jgi:uncharacterized membrane protein
MTEGYNAVAGRSLERLAALSDGLFAVAMTLLVLDLKVPAAEAIRSDGALLRALADLAPRLLIYLMSFMILGIFWVGQQTQLNQLTQSDRHLTWIHLALLFAISLLPFSTSLMAEFITLRTALLVYWLNILAFGVILFAAWYYACHAGLLRPEVTKEMQRLLVRRIVSSQLLYAVGAALCVFSTYWSIGFILAVQLNYVLAPRFWLLRRL